MRLCIIILAIFISAPLFALGDKRLSNIGFMLDLSSDEYKNYSVSIRLGLDSMWAIGGKVAKSSDEFDNESLNGKLYLSSYWSKYWSSKFQLIYSMEDSVELTELTGVGGELNNSFNLWAFGPDLRSSIGFTLGMINYSQDGGYDTILGSSQAEKNFVQQYITFNLEQELATWLILSLSRTQYSYEDASNVSFVGSKGKFSSSTSFDGAQDFPESRTSLSIVYAHTDFEIDLSGSKTTSKITEYDYQKRGLFFVWFLNKEWTLSIGTDHIDYDSGGDTKNYSIGLDFTF